jgi:ABC-type phosphate transport system substrate-binding protein
VLTAVAADPQAIGYSMMGNSSMADVKLLAIDDIPPTRNEVGSQRYPLTVPLYFLHSSPDEPKMSCATFWPGCNPLRAAGGGIVNMYTAVYEVIK